MTVLGIQQPGAAAAKDEPAPARLTTGPGASGAESTATSSSAPLPQTPQDEVV